MRPSQVKILPDRERQRDRDILLDSTDDDGEEKSHERTERHRETQRDTERHKEGRRWRVRFTD